jgi:membrane protein YqaA with SNARE-associated domain
MPSIAHLIHVYGLLVVAGLIGLECVGLPLPGETVLIVASVIAGTKHDLNIASMILTAAGAAIIGRMIGYVIGREYGYWLLLRYGGYLWITQSRIKLGQYLFLRHGGKIILIAQFLPVLRSIVGILDRSQSHALAAFHANQHHRRISLGDVIWACRVFAGSAGRTVDRVDGVGVRSGCLNRRCCRRRLRETA